MPDGFITDGVLFALSRGTSDPNYLIFWEYVPIALVGQFPVFAHYSHKDLQKSSHFRERPALHRVCAASSSCMIRPYRTA
jgi:hypothetical protein